MDAECCFFDHLPTSYPCSFWIPIYKFIILNMFQHTYIHNTHIHFQRQIWIHVCNYLPCQYACSLRRTLVKMKLYFWTFLFLSLYCFVPCFKMEIRYFFVFDFLEHISSIPFFSSLNLQVYIPKIKIAKHFRLLLIILTEHELLSFNQI